MKKYIFTLITLLLTLSIQAYDFTVDGIYYNITSSTSNYVAVTYGTTSMTNTYSDTVIIPEQVSYNSTVYNVTSIGEYTFYKCTDLDSVSMPTSISTIGSYAFYGTHLDYVLIPSSVSTINVGAFRNSINLEIKVASANTSFSTEDGVLFSYDKMGLIQCPVGKKGSYTIPSTVESLGAGAFSGCIELDSVILSEGIPEIGKFTFYNCTDLKYISIPSSVTIFGYSTFTACTSLKTINISKNVVSIGDNCFYECTGLDTIYVENSDPSSISLGTEVFLNVNTANCILSVPKGSKLLYAAASQWKDFTHIIARSNAPEISSVAPDTAIVGVKYTYAFVAMDADDDSLTYTLSNAPTGMTIDSVITWTPAEGTTTSGEVTLTVSDGDSIATQKFTITVLNPPVISSTAPTTAIVGTEYSYTITATDANGDNLTYSLSDAPNGMSISGNVISWTPTSGTTTSGKVTLTVSDGSLSETEDFTISVSGNTPVITSTAPTTATVGTEYTYTVVAADADGDALIYTLSDAPDGMSISENVISWTPVSGTTTSGEVTLTVSDGSLSATEQFTITVSENSGTSVADITDEDISVYPNPVSSALTIKSNHTLECLQLISVSGAVIRTEMVSNSETSLDVQNLQNGIYLLQINTSEGSIIKRIVKQ